MFRAGGLGWKGLRAGLPNSQPQMRLVKIAPYGDTAPVYHQGLCNIAKKLLHYNPLFREVGLFTARHCRFCKKAQ